MSNDFADEMRAGLKKPRSQSCRGLQNEDGLEAIRGELPLAELAIKFDVHTTQIARWRAEPLKGAEAVFDPGKIPPRKVPDPNGYTSRSSI